MHKVIPLTMAALAALTAGACAKNPPASADAAQITDSIKAQEAQWEKDYAAKDVNALAAHYADDAVLVSPGDPPATSDVERRKELQTFLSDPNLKITFSADQVQAAQAGDLAYSRGHYSLTMTDKQTNKPVTSTGSYLTVYKKQPDGSWKAVEDFSSPGPASATAAK